MPNLEEYIHSLYYLFIYAFFFSLPCPLLQYLGLCTFHSGVGIYTKIIHFLGCWEIPRAERLMCGMVPGIETARTISWSHCPEALVCCILEYFCNKKWENVVSHPH